MPVWRNIYHTWFWFGAERDDRSSKNRKFKTGVFDRHYFYPNFKDLKQAVNDLTKEANQKQAEIKSIVPLTGSTAETYSHVDFDSRSSTFPNTSYGWGWGWGFGHGFGASYTGGILVILEQKEEITEAEYSSRMQAIERDEAISDLKPRVEEARKELSDLQAQLSKYENIPAGHLEIVEKKKMIGSSKYLVGDKTFDSHMEATSYIQDVTKKPDSLAQEIARASKELVKMEQELKSLEDA